MKLIVTRPQHDARELCEALEGHGIEALSCPLIEIRYRDEIEVPGGHYQAVLATSANGVRAFARHSIFADFRSVPLYAVGDASALEAEEQGFENVRSASGDLRALTDLVKARLKPTEGPLLYLTGSKISGDLAGMLAKDGFDVGRVVLYDAIAVTSLPQPIVNAVKDAEVNGVILMSPRTAKIWCARIADAGYEAGFAGVDHYCLSHAVADALKSGLKISEARIVIAEKLTQSALIKAVLARKRT